MTQAKQRFASFADYLSYDDGTGDRYELIDGALVILPTESGPNASIAVFLLLQFVQQGLSYLLIHPGKCEVQVPVLQAYDPQNRYPDLVILDEVHLLLIQKRLTITLEMPPPRLVVEVVSPGKANRDRDYVRKRDQYAATGIPEYWLIDPESQMVMILELRSGAYSEVGLFCGKAQVDSPTFGRLELTAEQILMAGA
jgi:Uma2 family endonuclease